MRSHVWLVAASGHLVTADWFFGQHLNGHAGAVILPRETKASTHDSANGWTPKPTEAPLVRGTVDSFELARRKDEWVRVKRQRSSSSENTWVNDKTCGWVAGFASEPFVCESDYSCATSANVVGCSSAGMEEEVFFTVCLDYQAVQAGACKTDNTNTKTGCCMTSSNGACITYVWPGATPKSMYRCFSQQGIYTMLDEPQSVIDERTRTTSTTSSTSSSTSTSETSPAQTTTAPPRSGDSGGGGTDTGAIVGGVVGGVAGLALIAGGIAWLVIRRRNKAGNVGSGAAYSAVAPGDTSYPGGGAGGAGAGYAPSSVSPQMSHTGYFSPASVGNSTATPPAGPAAYDPHHSYYEPGKPPEHAQQPPQQQQPGGAYTPYLSGAHPYPAAYPGHNVSELDTANVAAGQQGNPAEMPASSPGQR